MGRTAADSGIGFAVEGRVAEKSKEVLLGKVLAAGV